MILLAPQFHLLLLNLFFFLQKCYLFVIDRRVQSHVVNMLVSCPSHKSPTGHNHCKIPTNKRRGRKDLWKGCLQLATVLSTVNVCVCVWMHVPVYSHVSVFTRNVLRCLSVRVHACILTVFLFARGMSLPRPAARLSEVSECCFL